MIQLRKQDVRLEDGHYVIHIDPEAGTVKTDEPRDVVLHPHLIEKGFPELLASSKQGYLFIDPADDGDVIGPLKSRRNDIGEFARRLSKIRTSSPTTAGGIASPRSGSRLVCLNGRIPTTSKATPQRMSSRKAYDGDNTINVQAMYLAKFPRQEAQD